MHDMHKIKIMILHVALSFIWYALVSICHVYCFSVNAMIKSVILKLSKCS